MPRLQAPQGEVALHREHATPFSLMAGDCIDGESTLGRARLSVGKDDAVVPWVSRVTLLRIGSR